MSRSVERMFDRQKVMPGSVDWERSWTVWSLSSLFFPLLTAFVRWLSSSESLAFPVHSQVHKLSMSAVLALMIPCIRPVGRHNYSRFSSHLQHQGITVSNTSVSEYSGLIKSIYHSTPPKLQREWLAEAEESLAPPLPARRSAEWWKAPTMINTV